MPKFLAAFPRPATTPNSVEGACVGSNDLDTCSNASSLPFLWKRGEILETRWCCMILI